jgi:hypothetical protein
MEGEGSMRKKYARFEVVPVEVAEKILKQESSPAKRNGKRKLAVEKSGKAANGRRVVPKKVEVSLP